MRVYPKIAPIDCCAATPISQSIMNTAALSSTPTHHPSRPLASKPENARGLAALLLAAAVAALAVVADQLIETWIDDHLFLAWVALWAVVFAGSLLLTGTIRRMSARAIGGLNQWAVSRAQARAAARLQAQQAAALDGEPLTRSSRSAKGARALESHLFYI